MRCPACQAHNPPTATACTACQEPLTPRRKPRREKAPDPTDSPRTAQFDRQAQALFGFCLLSAIPLLGLVLGPIGLLRSWLFLRSGRGDVAFQAGPAAWTCLALAAATTLTNWLGVWFLVLGVWRLSGGE
jgi:hypothetical protein